MSPACAEFLACCTVAHGAVKLPAFASEPPGGNKENSSRTHRKGHGIARSNTRYVHDDISGERGVADLEADLVVRPQEVRCGRRSANRQRGTSPRGAKAKAINRNNGALIILAARVRTAEDQ